MEMLGSAVLLSVDSLVAAIAIGPLVGRGSKRLRLALLFGACDMAATLGAWGFGLAPQPWLRALTPGGLALCGIYLLASARIAAQRPGIVCLLPVLLALDNLSMPAPPAEALAFGAVSAALGYIGLAIGAAAAAPIARCRERWVGAGALAAFAVALLS